MTELEKMHATMLYDPNDSDIMTEQIRCLDRLYDFNNTRPTEMEKRPNKQRRQIFEKSVGVHSINGNLSTPHHHLTEPITDEKG